MTEREEHLARLAKDIESSEVSIEEKLTAMEAAVNALERDVLDLKKMIGELKSDVERIDTRVFGPKQQRG